MPKMRYIKRTPIHTHTPPTHPHKHTHIFVSVYIYIYIYIYANRCQSTCLDGVKERPKAKL